MIFDFFVELNWLAVVVAAVVWFVFSAIWYSVPAISKPWQEAAKVTPGEGPPLVTLLIPTFVGYFITTVIIALVVAAVGATTVTDGIILGISLGVGFGVMGALVSQLYEQKGAWYWLINGLNVVIAWGIVGAILAAWD